MSYFKNTDLRKIAVLSVLVLAFIGCDNRDEVAPTLSIQQEEEALRNKCSLRRCCLRRNPEHCSILAVSGYMGFDCSDRFILDHKKHKWSTARLNDKYDTIYLFPGNVGYYGATRFILDH